MMPRKHGASADLGSVGSLLQAISQRYNMKSSYMQVKKHITCSSIVAALVNGMPFLEVLNLALISRHR